MMVEPLSQFQISKRLDRYDGLLLGGWSDLLCWGLGDIKQINMSRDIGYYQKKMRDLQIENDVLREQLLSSSKSYRSVAPETIMELGSRNERMERQASKYEKSIKMELSSYLADSMIQGECYYRDRYQKMLTQPKNRYRLYM